MAMAHFSNVQYRPTYLPGHSGLTAPRRIIPSTIRINGVQPISINPPGTFGMPRLYRDPLYPNCHNVGNIRMYPSMSHPFNYIPLGPAPGPCRVCRYRPINRTSIYLQHCIPQCPAIITTHNLIFATSDYVGYNDIRPCAVYLPGQAPPTVTMGYNPPPVIYMGLFYLPYPDEHYTGLPGMQYGHGETTEPVRNPHGVNGYNPFWNVNSSFMNHAPARRIVRRRRRHRTNEDFPTLD